jgi:hypothetical protein
MTANEQEIFEACARIAEQPAITLGFPEHPEYEGDVRHIQRQVCFGIAAEIRRVMKEMMK